MSISLICDPLMRLELRERIGERGGMRGGSGRGVKV